MPALGGRDLARELHALNPGLRMLLMSGYAERTTIAPALGFPVVFLQKPFTVDSLARTVREALATRGTPEDSGAPAPDVPAAKRR